MKSIPINRLRSIMNKSPDDMVRVYSVQGVDALRAAEQRGYWCGVAPNDPVFDSPYDWMKCRMVEMLPSYSGDFPMWAWLKRPSTKIKKKDSVRISAMVPRSRILFSDYDSWHSVLNNGFIANSEAEHDRHTNVDIEPSWHRIFDFNIRMQSSEIAWRGDGRNPYVQLCIDRLNWDEITSIVLLS